MDCRLFSITRTCQAQVYHASLTYLIWLHEAMYECDHEDTAGVQSTLLGLVVESTSLAAHG
jgi:hypothetical protein